MALPGLDQGRGSTPDFQLEQSQSPSIHRRHIESPLEKPLIDSRNADFGIYDKPLGSWTTKRTPNSDKPDVGRINSLQKSHTNFGKSPVLDENANVMRPRTSTTGSLTDTNSSQVSALSLNDSSFSDASSFSTLSSSGTLTASDGESNLTDSPRQQPILAPSIRTDKADQIDESFDSACFTSPPPSLVDATDSSNLWKLVGHARSHTSNSDLVRQRKVSVEACLGLNLPPPAKNVRKSPSSSIKPDAGPVKNHMRAQTEVPFKKPAVSPVSKKTPDKKSTPETKTPTPKRIDKSDRQVKPTRSAKDKFPGLSKVKVKSDIKKDAVSTDKTPPVSPRFLKVTSKAPVPRATEVVNRPNVRRTRPRSVPNAVPVDDVSIRRRTLRVGSSSESQTPQRNRPVSIGSKLPNKPVIPRTRTVSATERRQSVEKSSSNKSLNNSGSYSSPVPVDDVSIRRRTLRVGSSSDSRTSARDRPVFVGSKSPNKTVVPRTRTVSASERRLSAEKSSTSSLNTAGSRPVAGSASNVSFKKQSPVKDSSSRSTVERRRKSSQKGDVKGDGKDSSGLHERTNSEPSVKPIPVSPGIAPAASVSRLPRKKPPPLNKETDLNSSFSSCSSIASSVKSFSSSHSRTRTSPTNKTSPLRSPDRHDRSKAQQAYLAFFQLQGVPDALILLSSGGWSERRQGLSALSNLLNAGRNLSRGELRKVCDVFTRMFHDPHGKVFSAFLETLMDLIKTHRVFLYDWMYVLITRLLTKTGSEMLGSVHAKLTKTLEVTRECFPSDRQFNILCRFIMDQTQTPNMKVKLALLHYMNGLMANMDPSDFVNNGDTRVAITRIIQWCNEPKSQEIRKESQHLLVSLFNLNTPEFSAMLSVLPKQAQDGATRVLHHSLGALSPRDTPQRSQARSEKEEIYQSIRQATADIESLNLDTHRSPPHTESQDSGIHTLHDPRADSPDRPPYNPAQYSGDGARGGAASGARPHVASNGAGRVNGYNREALAEAVFDDNELLSEEMPDMSDPVQAILAELSNHNDRHEQRQAAMVELLRLARENSASVWDDNFKTVLLLLLETLGDTDGHTRALAMRTLREMVRVQPVRFVDYVELTVLKVLEAHRDPIKEVVRAAEECAMTVATSVPAAQCLHVLGQIVKTQDFPVSLAAIKMLSKVIENASVAVVKPQLADMMPGLLKGYDDTESTVRKAAVFCLVALYVLIGEDFRVHLAHLNGSKIKLLNLYIKRAQTQQEGAAGDR